MKVSGYRGSSKTNGIPKKKEHKSPIDIEKPAKPSLKPGEHDARKCRADPADANSGTFEIKIGYFSSGSPEEWLDYVAAMKRN